MNIKYNTLVFEFENYDELDDYILVDKNYESLHQTLPYYLWYEFTDFKIWKNGKITNKNNKEFKIRTNINVDLYPQKNYKYWMCKGVHKVKLKELIWDIYSNKYTLKKSLLLHRDNTFLIDCKSGIFYRDNDFNNLRLDNLIKYEVTNEGTEIYHNKNNYFDYDLEIKRNVDDVLIIKEPVILDELPDLEIFSNGKIIDNRGKSKILIDKHGYESISYKGKNYRIHRLVAKAYLINNSNYDLVNHVDGNRSNNDVMNLEWVNNTINTLHGLLSIKMNNDDNIEKFKDKSTGIKGWIFLTSNKYREFIKMKILEELNMEFELWIFSHKTPLFLIYLPFSKIFGFKPDENTNGFRGGKYLYDNNMNNLIFNKFFGKDNPKFNDYFKGDLKYSDKTYKFICDNINDYLLKKDNDSHLLNILNNLGIDFNLYFDWLFDDIKILHGDDVGFIFFEEMKDYLHLLRNGNFVYVNNILELSLKYEYLNISRDDNRKIINFKSGVHRVVEDIPNSFGKKFIKNNLKESINFNYDWLFRFDSMM